MDLPAGIFYRDRVIRS